MTVSVVAATRAAEAATLAAVSGRPNGLVGCGERGSGCGHECLLPVWMVDDECCWLERREPSGPPPPAAVHPEMRHPSMPAPLRSPRWRPDPRPGVSGPSSRRATSRPCARAGRFRPSSRPTTTACTCSSSAVPARDRACSPPNGSVVSWAGSSACRCPTSSAWRSTAGSAMRSPTRRSRTSSTPAAG